MDAPKCRLCQRNHWLSVNCHGQVHFARTEADNWLAKQTPVATKKLDTQREGRRVLKGSTNKASFAKPTRTASTEKADPPTPAKAPADRAIEEKAAPGNAKPRHPAKKKAKPRRVK